MGNSTHNQAVKLWDPRIPESNSIFTQLAKQLKQLKKLKAIKSQFVGVVQLFQAAGIAYITEKIKLKGGKDGNTCKNACKNS